MPKYKLERVIKHCLHHTEIPITVEQLRVRVPDNIPATVPNSHIVWFPHTTRNYCMSSENYQPDMFSPRIIWDGLNPVFSVQMQRHLVCVQKVES